jgi:Dockerin type I domain/Thrombospondin type 3 repeat
LLAVLFVALAALPADGVSASDLDGDGVADSADVCLATYDRLQIDSDSDAIGNACDGDFNNSGFVNAADLAIFRTYFGTSFGPADLNSSGSVNAADLAIFRFLFGKPPGPSGIDNPAYFDLGSFDDGKFWQSASSGFLDSTLLR